MKTTRLPGLAPLGILLILVSACGGGGDGSGTGTMSMSVTDAAVDGAQKVVVEFNGVTLKPQNGAQFDVDFATPKRVDLLAFQGTHSALLFDQTVVPAGHYEWVRLKVNASDCAALNAEPATGSYIVLDDGTIETLQVPSGSQTGLKLVSGFNVAQGGFSDFTIDFDLRKSVVKPSGQDCHFLKPALRIVDNAQIGTVSGIVDASLLTGTSCSDADPVTGSAVYVYTGSGVVPDDVDSIAPDPITSALVTFNATTQKFEYTVGFLLAGPYTLSLTCQADLDNPEVDDGILFQQSGDVTVIADQTTTHDFSAAP